MTSNNSTDQLIGRLIDGRYSVLSKIARGGMATVYLATDTRLDRKVALKVMHNHLNDDEAFRSRFIREAHSAARLAHPNVVSVFDQGEDFEMAYLVMEYLPGITLRELLDEHEKLTPEQALDIIEPVLSGLSAAHSAGIVHRDIKPENVLLADDGRIKISDFGLARASTAATATGQALLGTIAYLSPELVTRGVADVRSDLYAIGIMLYELLTGEQPFKGEQPVQIAYQHANDSVPPPSLIDPAIPVELDELVLWATAKDPENRPSDAGALLAELKDVRHLLISSSQALDVTRVIDSETAPTQVLSGSTQPTAVIPKNSTRRSQTLVKGATKSLEQKSRKRTVFGRLVFALVAVLAIGSGTVGWYFGSGPGAYVTVPEVQQWLPEVASSELQRLELEVKTEERWDYQTEKGKVSGTEPDSGEQLHKGSEIILFVSKGPQSLPLPDLIDKSEAAANAELVTAGFTAGSIKRQFSADQAKGLVIALLGSDGKELKAEQKYPEKSVLDLIVSSGELPKVRGLAFEDAETVLTAANLKAQKGKSSYHDTVPEGKVINYESSDKAVFEGDTVKLQISKGPKPVKIPNVVGLTWDEAKPMLNKLGLKLDYNTLFDNWGSVAKVESISPGVGDTVPKGSTVKIVLSLVG